MWVTEPELFTKFLILEVFVKCRLILSEREGVCKIAVTILTRVGGFKGGKKKERRKKTNPKQPREETRNSFIPLQGSEGF